MNDFAVCVVTVAGGLGAFLLGMKHLSEGLQSVAGAGLRRFMALATTRRLAGVGTGIASTILVQSSSIITVMLVGFVSSGLMKLPQAVNVIIGANIGTTVTVWIVAFAPDPQLLGLMGVSIGSLLYFFHYLFFFFRRETVHNIGLAVLGLGMVFLGMYLMSKGVAPIKGNPDVQAAFTRMDASSLAGVALTALAAAVFTAVVQSSAASIAIAMTLASQQLITYEMAISMLFGANIGTTMTAWLAAIGGSAPAKRTALAHTLSNVIGSVLFIPLVLPVFVPLGKALFPHWNAVTETAKGPMMLGVMSPIAVTDTIFSILRGLLFFPFAKPFADFITWLVPSRNGEKPHLSALGRGVRFSPVIACDQALMEVYFMKDSCLDMLEGSGRMLDGGIDAKASARIIRREEILDDVQREVTSFLGGIMAKRLPLDVAERARLILRLTDELETVSDEAAFIVKVVRRLEERGEKMSGKSKALLVAAHGRVMSFAGNVLSLVRSPRPVVDVAALEERRHEIHEFLRDARMTLLGRIGPDDPGSTVRVLGELDVVGALERVADCCQNIAEAMSGGKRVHAMADK